MAHEDWDLFAIVRSCKAATFTATTTTPNPPTVTSTTTPRSPNTTSCFDSSHENASFSFPNLLQPPTNESQELHQLLINFNPTTTTTISSTITSAIGINPNSTFSDVAGFIGQQHIQQGHHHHLVPAPTNHTSIGAPSTTGFDRFQEQHHQQQHQSQTPEQQQRKQNLPQLQATQTSPILSPTTQPQTPRSRKRKNHQKKIVRHVTADNLSADSWAWRKYGQKPIKGSPYPRNYYRCSSCKGCAARKQVERSNTEPNMFIVTYTGEHKHAKPVHRNSLAGSTRTKPSPTGLPEANEAVSGIKIENACSSTSELSTTSLKSGTPENEETVADGEPDFPEMEVDPDALSDNDYDLLIPNTGAMSDAVLLGLTNGAQTKGSDRNSESGLTQSKSDPFSNTV
ncbi:probable WRKY transcription factor 27 [Vigna umbellata]|uniref:probable WRKY transcription factor 27 n=1 Tax=Vigna umbellata TaxID=87088 RepID=UPI001F5E999F|nr:probable WRKY transcription factor 27 [Vigna umbellata]